MADRSSWVLALLAGALSTYWASEIGHSGAEGDRGRRLSPGPTEERVAPRDLR